MSYLYRTTSPNDHTITCLPKTRQTADAEVGGGHYTITDRPSSVGGKDGSIKEGALQVVIVIKRHWRDGFKEPG